MMVEVTAFIAGYFVQLAATAILVKQIWKTKSVYGLSLDTQLCFLVATLSRSVWTFDTRLVTTPIAYFELVSSFVLLSLVCGLWIRYRKSTTMGCKYTPLLLAGTLILSFFVHPGSSWLSSQVLVSFTIFLEALALVPQIFLMSKLEDVDGINSLYVALLAISRMIRLTFWIVLFIQGDRFLALFGADIIHTAICGRSLFLWLSRLRGGKGRGWLAADHLA